MPAFVETKEANLGTVDVGQSVELTNTFKDGATMAPTDPSGATLRVKKPSHGEGEYDSYTAELTHTSTGIYSMYLVIDEAGVWRFKWIGTGSVAAVKNSYLRARGSLLD